MVKLAEKEREGLEVCVVYELADYDYVSHIPFHLHSLNRMSRMKQKRTC